MPFTRGCMTDPNLPMFHSLLRPHFPPFYITPPFPPSLITPPSFLAFHPFFLPSFLLLVALHPYNNINSVSHQSEKNKKKRKIYVPPRLRTKAASLTPPLSPSLKFPAPVKRGSDPNALNMSSEKVVRRSTNRTFERKKSKSFKEGTGNGLSSCVDPSSWSYSSSLLVEAPGSIAAVRREQLALQQAQRKMRIARYGRSKSAKFKSSAVPLDNTMPAEEMKRCSFITPNSDPIYVAYHDE
ncbi:hypothetical protein V6N13_129561 [Hibiscus sabdariffa]